MSRKRSLPPDLCKSKRKFVPSTSGGEENGVSCSQTELNGLEGEYVHILDFQLFLKLNLLAFISPFQDQTVFYFRITCLHKFPPAILILKILVMLKQSLGTTLILIFPFIGGKVWIGFL